MWYKYKTDVELNHIPADINQPWTPQWEHDYTFSINREGDYRLYFLLFKNETQEYQKDKDYIGIAKQKLQEADRILNLSISIPYFPYISNLQASPNSTLQNKSVEISCSVNDADGVNSVLLYLQYPDNVRHILNITNSKFDTNYSYNQIYEKAGSYQYYIWANDITGNFSISPTFQFNITDIPTISELQASPNSTINGGFINISSFIYDIDGLKNVTLNITYPNNQIEEISIINNKTGNVYYYNQTYNKTGIYTYYIWVKDIVGNTKFSEIKEFLIIEE
jgi:hypothetical protein